MEFEEALKIELSDISVLQDKIFPITAQQGATIPYVTYTPIRSERERNLSDNHTGNISENYDLDIFDESYSSVKTLCKYVENVIKTMWNRRIAGTGPFIQSISIVNKFISYEKETGEYHGTIEFLIFYKEE